MKKITRAEAVKRIEIAKDIGHFCSAKVLQREPPHELRTFNFRGGVRKGVTGVGMPFNPNDHKLIVVWDRIASDFRMLAIEGIQELIIEGEKFKVEG